MSWVGEGLCFVFFQLQKRKMNDKGGDLCQAWRNVRGFWRSFMIKHDGGGWMGQKRIVLAWRNYWTAPQSITVFVYCICVCSKFTGEHPCRSVISIKLQNNFIEITLRHGCSPVNLLHVVRAPFPKNTPGGLLLFIWIPAGVGYISWRHRPEVFCKKGVIKNVAKFVGKHPCGVFF